MIFLMRVRVALSYYEKLLFLIAGVIRNTSMRVFVETAQEFGHTLADTIEGFIDEFKVDEETAKERSIGKNEGYRCNVSGNYIEVLKMTSLIQDLVQDKENYGNFREAKAYVTLVDKKIKETGLSLEKACKEVGIEPATYDMSKIVMQNMADVALL